MIISRKRFNEKINEAVERAERERWMYNKFDQIEREHQERINEILRHMFELEKKIEQITDKKRGK